MLRYAQGLATSPPELYIFIVGRRMAPPFLFWPPRNLYARGRVQWPGQNMFAERHGFGRNPPC